MSTQLCPHCKEEIKADARKCKHCGTLLYRTRKEKVFLALKERIQMPLTPPGDFCKGWCYYDFGDDKELLQQCLDDCDAVAAMVAVWEALHKELAMSLLDIIWSGGDIDPVPDYLDHVEKAVRASFAEGAK
jgi:hypothetical protein